MIHTYTDYSLLPHNTFGMNVSAARFIEYDSVSDLKSILQSITPEQPLLHIGQGSNILFMGDYKGIVLHSCIRGYEKIKEDEHAVWLRVGAGEVWDDFVAYCIAKGWSGSENLSLIPGEVGASAVQNIGAYGVEVKDLITQVETVDTATSAERVFSVDECKYAYRHSLFKECKGQYIVTYVTYRLNKKPMLQLDYGNIRSMLAQQGDTITPADVRNAVIAIRESKLPDPKIQGNAGSFFVNPIIKRAHYEALIQNYPSMPCYEVDESHVKIPAAWMIDQCGWKGRAWGNAGVHDKQALVLVNRGGATGKEVIELSQAICQSVKEKFDIEIHPEVNII